MDPDQYRVLLLKARISAAYMDEIHCEMGRGENVDVIGSRVPTLFTRERYKNKLPACFCENLD